MKIFCYSPRQTVLHKIPSLLKLAFIGIGSYLIFKVNLQSLLVALAILIVAKLWWKINGWKQIITFFVTIFLLSSLFNLDYQSLTLSQLKSPLIYTVRLTIILIINIFFVFSTTPQQIAKSVAIFFCWHKPWQKKIFLTIFVVFSLIPIVFHKYRQLELAQKSRIYNLNPFKRIIYKLYPFLIICLETADKLSKSLEARSF